MKSNVFQSPLDDAHPSRIALGVMYCTVSSWLCTVIIFIGKFSGELKCRLKSAVTEPWFSPQTLERLLHNLNSCFGRAIR